MLLGICLFVCFEGNVASQLQLKLFLPLSYPSPPPPRISLILSCLAIVAYRTYLLVDICAHRCEVFSILIPSQLPGLLFYSL